MIYYLGEGRETASGASLGLSCYKSSYCIGQVFEMSLPSPSHFYAYSTQTQPSDLDGVLYTFLSYYNLFLFYGSPPPHATCRILVPWPGIKPAPPAVEVRSLNRWIPREVPTVSLSQSQWSLASPLWAPTGPRRCLSE